MKRLFGGDILKVRVNPKGNFVDVAEIKAALQEELISMAGVGDKHIDLYWAIWSLQYNLKTDQYTDYFLDQYGRENFDHDMLNVVAAFELFG